MLLAFLVNNIISFLTDLSYTPGSQPGRLDNGASKCRKDTDMTDIYGTRKQFASTNIAEIFALRNVHSQHDLTTPQSTSKDRLLSTGASSRCIPRGMSV